METESRNWDWTGILSVVERQVYRRNLKTGEVQKLEEMNGGSTAVTTTVKFRSRLGDRLRARARRGEGAVAAEDGEEPKKGFLASWSTAGIQRSIEAIASRRAQDSQGKHKQGMSIVLERLRNGGLLGVVEGMRQDRETVFGPEGPFKRTWKETEGSGYGSSINSLENDD